MPFFGKCSAEVLGLRMNADAILWNADARILFSVHVRSLAHPLEAKLHALLN